MNIRKSPGRIGHSSSAAATSSNCSSGLCTLTIGVLAGISLMIVLQAAVLPLVVTNLVQDPALLHQAHHSLGQVASSGLEKSLYGFTGGSSSGTRSRQRLPPEERRIGPRLSSDRPPDGTFNGAPIYLHEDVPLDQMASAVHCMGDNYQPDSWKARSCRFSFLCFNTRTTDYEIFETPHERALSALLVQRSFIHASDTMTVSLNQRMTVSLGGINLKWGKEGIPRLEWFPKITPIPDPEELEKLDVSNRTRSFFMLPDDTVMMPFHSMNGANPGHLVWDDFMPAFTLLHMFGLTHMDLLMMRYVLPLRYEGDRGLWASCDLREEKTHVCNHMMKKFWPLMVGPQHPYRLRATTEYDLNVTKEAQQKLEAKGKPTPELVCAKTGVAGIGSLTDHGFRKMHGWEEEDYLFAHNHGRGGVIYEFRNYLMRNMGYDDSPVPTKGPHRIVFSEKSSDIPARNVDFSKKVARLQSAVPNVQVESYIFKELSLERQVEVVADAAIYITVCGGGAVSAMFLPKGSTAIIFYSESGGAKNNRMTHKPALLDWDLFNAMTHIRVHWLPRHSMNDMIDEGALVALVRRELELIESKVFD